MSADRFAFESFVLDRRAGDLRRNDSTIELRPKVYVLLVYLVEHRGRLVPKDELIHAVWGDVNVTDGSLNRTIAELRDALGDDPRTPRLIETVPRRGYKFIGEVQEVGSVQVGRLSHFMLLFSDRVFSLRAGENIIGRVPECDVQIIGPSVSRRHACILVTGENATIEDLGSLNGTFVGDQRISVQTPLQDGDEIRIGTERVRLMSDRTVRARTEPAI